MKEPRMAAIMLMPMAIPRCSTGKASVRIAVEFAIRSAPPIPWITRPTISHIAPAPPVHGVRDNPIDASVKMAKPRLYIRTRPRMSPMRPNVTTRTAVTTR
jgi:hypothetical protein